MLFAFSTQFPKQKEVQQRNKQLEILSGPCKAFTDFDVHPHGAAKCNEKKVMMVEA